MIPRPLVALLAASALTAAAPVSAQVDLTIGGGRVSLSATDATLRDILAAWERTGGTRIFGAEQLPNVPLTLRLENLPEERALEILLRSVNGYVAAPRPEAVADASRFDRIMILGGTPRPRAATGAMPAAAPEPAADVPLDMPPGDLPPLEETEDDVDADQPVRIVPAPRQRPGPFSTFPRLPQPESEPEAADTAPAASPDSPGYQPQPTPPPGVSVPGMVVPAPQDDEPDARPGS